MKKILCVCLILVLCFSLFACSQSGRYKMEITYDSMDPTFSSGDTIIYEEVDPATLEIGDIIAYWTVSNGQRMVYVSRISQIYDGGNGLRIFETKDDANTQPNPYNVHQSNIVGKYVRNAYFGLF